ncbi:MFS general substrate transporter [Tothia fuscella]|uniref:MFS general substrate transporter n=1 Tax=Tothia fuscella TaxID=1048955 RepID=A0A9P4U4U0_9PEZI|nr:MFS general substrate transporter [Tothia fuscella]
MADPEVGLVRSPLDTTNETDTGLEGRNSFSTPQTPSRQSMKSSSNWEAEFEKTEDIEPEEHGEWPIVTHYLTFETELPSPTLICRSSTTTLGPPEQPDLVKYTSPFEWSQSRKRWIICLSCTATVCTAFTAGAYSPGLDQMKQEWGVSTVAILCGITTFTCGFGIAPMVLAPFSEIMGRRPVFIATGILFVLCQLCCALTRSFGGMLVARFFVGVGGSTFSTMVGGVVSDIYHTSDRNTPMALFSGAALCGTGLGPMVTGFIAQHLSWRWMFYLQVIMDGVIIMIMTVCFKETRGSVLLSRKARVLNQFYEQMEEAGYFGVKMPIDGASGQYEIQRIRWKVKSDEERTSIGKMIAISLYRPFLLLLTEPVVFWFSLWVAFSWAVLYLTLAAIPLVFSTIYGFNIEQSGAVFSAISIAAILFTVVCIYQEKTAQKLNKLPNTPEARLYFACYESALMPIGLFIFGWTSRPDIHWIVPTIALGLATCGIFSIYLSVFNYLADCYHRYASSALAAQSFCRNMLGGAIPLVTIQMYEKLLYGPASSLLGGIGTLLTIVPWVLLLYGPRIRARSKFASEIVE